MPFDKDNRIYIVYTVIVNFKHRGLRLLFTKNNARGVSGNMLQKLKRILVTLDGAESPDDMNLPGFNLHTLKGRKRGTWAVTVTGNFRVTFKISGDKVHDVDLIDYH